MEVEFVLIAVTTNLYTQAAESETTYIIPGPPLYGSAAGTGSGTGTGTGSSSTVAPVSLHHHKDTEVQLVDTCRLQPTQPSSSASAPSQSSAPGGTVAQYGQCGGIGFSGPTAWYVGELYTVSLVLIGGFFFFFFSVAPFTCKVTNGKLAVCCDL